MADMPRQHVHLRPQNSAEEQNFQQLAIQMSKAASTPTDAAGVTVDSYNGMPSPFISTIPPSARSHNSASNGGQAALNTGRYLSSALGTPPFNAVLLAGHGARL